MSVKDKVGVALIVDDIVEGATDDYGVTDMHMTRGRILHIKENEIQVRVMSHNLYANYVGHSYWVEADKFKKIGHIKPFVREEFLENLAKGEVEKILEYDLYEANLSGANLSGANLSGGVLYNEYTAFFALVCPEEGSFIAWKVCCDNLIVKLRVSEDAQRSSATSRKCRCSKAEVIQIEDVEGNVMPDDTIAYSRHDCEFTYQKGKIVEVDDFDTNRWNECSTGIHFFMTRREAVLYY